METARPLGNVSRKCPNDENISPIATANTGTVRIVEITNRRFISAYSGSACSSRVTSFGSSAMPQIGHEPGPIRTISGCIGQVYSMAAAGEEPEAAAGEELEAEAAAGAGLKNFSGSAAKRSRQRAAQK